MVHEKLPSLLRSAASLRSSFPTANAMNNNLRESQIVAIMNKVESGQVQGPAKEWSLGCVIPASLLPLTAGARFTTPRDHS